MITLDEIILHHEEARDAAQAASMTRRGKAVRNGLVDKARWHGEAADLLRVASAVVANFCRERIDQ